MDSLTNKQKRLKAIRERNGLSEKKKIKIRYKFAFIAFPICILIGVAIIFLAAASGYSMPVKTKIAQSGFLFMVFSAFSLIIFFIIWLLNYPWFRKK